jgi:hypothetical protein
MFGLRQTSELILFPRISAILTRSATDFAPIFLMACPRCIFTVGSASPVFAATCLFINPDVTRAITSRSRALSVSNRARISDATFSLSRRMRSRAMAVATASNRSCSRNGFVRKSTAPAFIARAAIGISAYPVMKMMGMSIFAGELGLKVEAAHARQPDVEHQTARGIGLPACQQFGGRAKQFGLQADVSEETMKRLSHRDIVVDDEDNRVLRTARKRHVDGTFPC